MSDRSSLSLKVDTPAHPAPDRGWNIVDILNEVPSYKARRIMMVKSWSINAAAETSVSVAIRRLLCRSAGRVMFGQPGQYVVQRRCHGGEYRHPADQAEETMTMGRRIFQKSGNSRRGRASWQSVAVDGRCASAQRARRPSLRSDLTRSRPRRRSMNGRNGGVIRTQVGRVPSVWRH